MERLLHAPPYILHPINREERWIDCPLRQFIPSGTRRRLNNKLKYHNVTSALTPIAPHQQNPGPQSIYFERLKARTTNKNPPERGLPILTAAGVSLSLCLVYALLQGATGFEFLYIQPPTSPQRLAISSQSTARISASSFF